MKQTQSALQERLKRMVQLKGVGFNTAAEFVHSLEGPRPKIIGYNAAKIDGKLYRFPVYASVITDKPDEHNRIVHAGSSGRKRMPSC